MKPRIAVFPGSYDPLTLGHVDIVERGCKLFDTIILAIGVNAGKQYYFPLEQRLQWLQETFHGNPQVEIDSYSGLTVDFCKLRGATHILRGLRNAADYSYELVIARVNASLAQNIETVFLAASPEYDFVSSTIVRELIVNKGRFDHLVPPCVSRDA